MKSEFVEIDMFDWTFAGLKHRYTENQINFGLVYQFIALDLS